MKNDRALFCSPKLTGKYNETYTLMPVETKRKKTNNKDTSQNISEGLYPCDRQVEIQYIKYIFT